MSISRQRMSVSRRRRLGAAVITGLLLLLLLLLRGEPTGGPAPPRAGAGDTFFEVRQPNGAARGTVLLLHGGGWRDNGTTWVRAIRMQRYVNQLTSWGWRVVNVSYRQPTGLQQLQDGAAHPTDIDPRPMLESVSAYYDQTRAAFPGQPVCVMGESSGGHLALMTAVDAADRGVAAPDCVVDLAGPTDLTTYKAQAGPPPGGNTSCTLTNAWTTVNCLVRELVFGTDDRVLRLYSPALRWSSAIKSRVFAVYTPGDPVVPYAQGQELRAAVPAQNLTMNVVRDRTGGTSFVHSVVDAGALRAMWVQLHGWLDQIAPSAAADRAIPTNASSVRACQAEPASRTAPLRAGLQWTQAQSGDGNLVPAASCTRDSDTLATGLTLRAPADDEDNPRVSGGQYAEQRLVAPAAHQLTSLSTRLRAYRRSKDWTLGVFASSSRDRRGRLIAGCSGGTCKGLQRIAIATGGTSYVAPGTRSPTAATRTLRLDLPAGTVRLSLVLQCANRLGCDTPRGAARPDDSDGNPAALAAYDPVVRIARAA